MVHFIEWEYLESLFLLSHHILLLSHHFTLA